MVCPNCRSETQPGFFCHACDAYMADLSVGVNAGLARRLAAQVIDILAGYLVFLLIGAVSCAVGTAGSAVGSVGGRREYAGLSGCTTCLGSLFLGVAAYTAFALWFLAQGKTPGKWLVSIRVVDKTAGHNPGLGRMLVREVIGKMASGLFFGIGYFWAIWDPANQCWHDKIAGTLVVREGLSSTSESTGPAAIAGGAPLTISAPMAMAAPASDRDSHNVGLRSGTAVPGQVFCGDCGSSVAPADAFCEQCGSRLNV